MKMHLRDYIKISNMISPEICESSVEQLNNLPDWQQHVFYNSKKKTDGTLSGENELDVNNSPISNHPVLMQKVWDALNEYIVKELNFPWYAGWSGYSSIRYNRYQNNKLMANHCDHIHSLFDGERKGIPILSILGILNDDYKGGEFIMFDEDEEIKLKKGDIMVFPSNFLYPHTVKPVTEGTRYSFVSWAW